MLILLTLVWCYRNASKFNRRGNLKGPLRSARALALSILLIVLGGTHVGAVDPMEPRRPGGESPGLGKLADQAGGISAGGTHYREGTGLAPTAGRVMLLGRRWVFVSGDAGEMEQMGKPAPATTHATTHLPRRRRVLASPKIRTTSPIGREGADPIRPSSANPNAAFSSHGHDSIGSAGRAHDSGHPSSARQQWVLVENLMLQRIVQAIRSDSIDDSWIVTGRITEFFDENYLILESAKRGNR